MSAPVAARSTVRHRARLRSQAQMPRSPPLRPPNASRRPPARFVYAGAADAGPAPCAGSRFPTGELSHLLLLDREARQCITHRVPFHFGGDLPPRVAAGSGGRNPLCACEVHLASFMGAATPKLIDGAVADGGQQPGTKGALARVKG